MEDAFEGYIKHIRNSKEPKTEQKQIRDNALVTLQHRGKCHSKALKIVEFLIEGQLCPEVFLRCLKHIDQSYYQDVVEERAVSKLCGYSLCGKQIPPYIPKKRFFIDSKQNKVYDATDRKNYCSNYCYKASIYIKQQIDNTPLWLRKYEELPKFSLLPSSQRGIPGEEIDQNINKATSGAAFTSVSSFAQISLDELKESKYNTNKSDNKKTKQSKLIKPMQTVHESVENPDSAIKEIDVITNCDNSVDDTPAFTENNDKPVEERNQATIKKCISLNFKQEHEKTISGDDIMDSIEKYFKEWFTFDTYIFLYGETKVKELFNEETFKKYFGTLKSNDITISQQKKYLEICRKLNFSELAEDKLDRMVICNILKPLPDYKKIKEDSKTMDLKIHGFYKGITYKLETKTNINQQNKQEEVPQTSENNNTEEESAPAVLPLVDSISQNTIRRKIYLNSINKTIANLIQQLGIPHHLVMNDVKSLVQTFKLQAHNVVFKPLVWNLIAYILIKILSIRDTNLNGHLETKQSQIFITIMFRGFPNAQIRIDKLLEDIQNVDFLKYSFFK